MVELCNVWTYGIQMTLLYCDFKKYCYFASVSIAKVCERKKILMYSDMMIFAVAHFFKNQLLVFAKLFQNLVYFCIFFLPTRVHCEIISKPEILEGIYAGHY